MQKIFSPFFVGITGGHGVGKSTLSRDLKDALTEWGKTPITLLCGLGDYIRSLDIEVGSGANADSVAAIYAAHLQRELSAPDQGIVLLDRCTIDALAYVRSLNVTSNAVTELYEQISIWRAQSLGAVLHCKMTELFRDKGASHETPELRSNVVRTVPKIITELQLSSMNIDVGSENCTSLAKDYIIEQWNAFNHKRTSTRAL